MLFLCMVWILWRFDFYSYFQSVLVLIAEKSDYLLIMFVESTVGMNLEDICTARKAIQGFLKFSVSVV